MGRRGPAKGSPTAQRCGPFGLVAQHGLPADPPAGSVDRSQPLPTTPPEWLPELAAAVYRETLPRLTGRASAADLEAVCAFCLAAAENRKLARTRKPNARTRAEMRAQARVLRSLGDALGLTPIGRARLPQPAGREDTDGDEAIQASQLA